MANGVDISVSQPTIMPSAVGSSGLRAKYDILYYSSTFFFLPHASNQACCVMCHVSCVMKYRNTFHLFIQRSTILLVIVELRIMLHYVTLSYTKYFTLHHVILLHYMLLYIRYLLLFYFILFYYIILELFFYHIVLYYGILYYIILYYTCIFYVVYIIPLY